MAMTFDQGKEIAKLNGIDHYFECSAKNNEGVDEIFEKAAELAWQAEQRTHLNLDEISIRTLLDLDKTSIPSDPPESRKTNACNCFAFLCPPRDYSLVSDIINSSRTSPRPPQDVELVQGDMGDSSWISRQPQQDYEDVPVDVESSSSSDSSMNQPYIDENEIPLQISEDESDDESNYACTIS